MIYIINLQSEDCFFSTSASDIQDITQFNGMFVQTVEAKRKIARKQTSKLNPYAQVFVPRKQQHVPTFVNEKQENTQQADTKSKTINKKPYKNVNTDKAINNFIQQIYDLYYVISKDLNTKALRLFTTFKKDIYSLTDKHRKQILEVIPYISEMIDQSRLNIITIITILYSISKKEVCNKLNSNSNNEDECIKYEQAVKNLIDKILIKLQKYETYGQLEWSNIFYSFGLLMEQHADLLTAENINKLLVKFNKNIIEQGRNFKLIPQHNNIILWFMTKYIKYSKLDSGSIVAHAIIQSLLDQVEFNYNCFNTREISGIILSIAKLSTSLTTKQSIDENINILALLLHRIIQYKELNINQQEISNIIYALGNLLDNIMFSQDFITIIRDVYNILLSKALPIASKFNIISSSCIMNGFITFINKNIISYNKPNKHLIRDVFFNKVIKNPSIINNNELYRHIHAITFFQEYLTKTELIKIFENITFFMPETNKLRIYFIAMGYLLVKVRRELYNDNKNTDLTALEYKVKTAIIKVMQEIQFDIKKFSKNIIKNMYNTCSLIYNQEYLTELGLCYKNIYQSKKKSEFKKIYIDSIVELIAEPENLKIAYNINNISIADVCIVRSNGSILAIEIQNSVNYIDNQGDYPASKTLLKRELYKQENIDFLEINCYKFQSYNKREVIACLRYFLLSHGVELKLEYYNNTYLL